MNPEKEKGKAAVGRICRKVRIGIPIIISMTIILSNLNRFAIFFNRRFLGKFAVKWILSIPQHLAYVDALLCETLMSAKQAINDRLGAYKVV